MRIKIIILSMILMTVILNAGEYQLNITFELSPLQQSREEARKINALKFYQNKLYLGTGDYGVNTGPTPVFSYDLESKVLVKEFIVDDEAIMSFLNIDKMLAIPGADATEDWSLGNIYLKDAQWQKCRTIPKGLHVFDIEQYKGKLYCATGSVYDLDKQNQPAFGAVYASGDTAKTWTLSYGTPSDSYSVYRVHELINFKESLYAFVHDFYGEYKKNLPPELQKTIPGDSLREVNILKADALGSSDFLKFERERWTYCDVIPETDLAYINPIVWKDKILFECFSGKYVVGLNPDMPGIKHTFYLYDGTQVQKIDLPITKIINYTTDNGNLYLLGTFDKKSIILVLRDFQTYDTFYLPEKVGYLSLAVLGSEVFLGANDGNLYKTNLLYPQLYDKTKPLLYPDSFLFSALSPQNYKLYNIALLKKTELIQQASIQVVKELKSKKIIIKVNNVDSFQYFSEENNTFNSIIIGKTVFKLNPTAKSYVVTKEGGRFLLTPSDLTMDKLKKDPVSIGQLDQEVPAKGNIPAHLLALAIMDLTQADAAITFTDGFQTGLPQGKVTLENIYRQNYYNYVSLTKLTGVQIKAIMAFNKSAQNNLLLETSKNIPINDELSYMVALPDYLALNSQEFCGKKFLFTSTEYLTAQALALFIIKYPIDFKRITNNK